MQKGMEVDEAELENILKEENRNKCFNYAVFLLAKRNYFEKALNVAAVGDIAGFVLATNVKLAEGFPGTVTQVNPGEAFNLLINGFIAVQLDTGATLAKVTPNAKVYVILETGKLTTADKAESSKVVELPGCVFTGIKETQGAATVAEIFVK